MSTRLDAEAHGEPLALGSEATVQR